MTDAAGLPLRALAGLVADRAVSPVELFEAARRRADLLQARLNAFIALDDGVGARAAVAAAHDIGRGRYRGTAHGVPVSVKDLYDVSGWATTAGSCFAELCARPAARDATVWARLSRGGALLLGKTNLHEFALGATGVNPHHGAVRNPWDVNRVAGGSSGGSAAATAAGLGHVSIGTDTGGSIRIPAALCGVTGFKPTRGLLPIAGAFPVSESLDHVGLVTRGADACAAVLELLTGRANAISAPPADPSPECLGDLRVGLLGAHTRLADGAIRQVFDDAVASLVDLGASVEEVELRDEHRGYESALVITAVEAAGVHRSWLHAQPHRYGDDVRARLRAGEAIPRSRYLEAKRTAAELTTTVGRHFGRHDLLVGPTTPILAPRIRDVAFDGRAVERQLAPHALLSRFTRLYNVTGLPAVSVPCGFARDGDDEDARPLPVGLQIGGPPNHDARVLRVAAAFQAATDWHLRTPPQLESQSPRECVSR